MQPYRTGRRKSYQLASCTLLFGLVLGVLLYPTKGLREEAYWQQPALTSSEEATQSANSDHADSNTLTPDLAAAAIEGDTTAAAVSFEMAQASTKKLLSRSEAVKASATTPTDAPSREITALLGPLTTAPTAGPGDGVPLPNSGASIPSNGPGIYPAGPAAPAAHSSPTTVGNPIPSPPAGSVPPAQPPTAPLLTASPTNPAPPLQPSSPPTNLSLPPSPGAPAPPSSIGTPQSSSGPPSGATAPGQTPGNPIRPIGTSPNGGTILPIPGASCSGGNNCGSHAWQFFDPPVAVGYNYQLNPTTPNQSLTFGVTGIMVTSSVGSGIYDLWLYDAVTGTYVDSRKFSSTGQTITIAADPSANPNGAFNVLKFLLSLTPQEEHELGITNPSLGLTRFSIRGIDPAAGLDPEDPNAFITGLMFAGDINGDLIITPLAVDSTTGLPVDPPAFEVPIPEPSTIVLFVTGLLSLGLLGRRRKGKAPYRRHYS
jgi:hypothetical protein